MLLASAFALQVTAQKHRTENVVIVTLDGLRWQEVYHGADSSLIHSKYTEDIGEVARKFSAPTAEARRQKLFPFLWSEVAHNGQLYGDRDNGGDDHVVNPYNFSYPGYNEIMTGYPDKRMNTNNGILDPNMNVLEFLGKQKGFQNRVAAFSSWERFPQIFNVGRSGLLVNSGYMKLDVPGMNERLQYLNQQQDNAPHFLGDSTRIDFMTYEMGREYMKQYKPRVMYFAFDETDDMAHAGNYKFYLERANQEDGYLQQLWAYIQSDPFYKNRTTLIITCDHGRGEEPQMNWRNHGSNIKGSEQTWFAVIGPDTPAAGIMKNLTTRHEQLAQTIANLLGYDFAAAAGHPVGEAITSVTAKNPADKAK